jgi:hypothetical protein
VNLFTNPLLALLPDEIPSAFLALPPEEEAWRGRYFLMVWAADFPEHFAWAAAMVNGTEATETKALVESVDDAHIVEQVRLRNEHYAAPAAEATKVAAEALAAEEASARTEYYATGTADPMPADPKTPPLAAVEMDRQADNSFKPVGVWWATPSELHVRVIPGDTGRDAFVRHWMEGARPPILADGTQGDWQDWLRDACWRLSNGHTTMMVACVPERAIDATYRREVLGTGTR